MLNHYNLEMGWCWGNDKRMSNLSCNHFALFYQIQLSLGWSFAWKIVYTDINTQKRALNQQATHLNWSSRWGTISCPRTLYRAKRGTPWIPLEKQEYVTSACYPAWSPFATSGRCLPLRKPFPSVKQKQLRHASMSQGKNKKHTRAIPWNVSHQSHFISWKTLFLILAGSALYQIWLSNMTRREPP